MAEEIPTEALELLKTQEQRIQALEEEVALLKAVLERAGILETASPAKSNGQGAESAKPSVAEVQTGKRQASVQEESNQSKEPNHIPFVEHEAKAPKASEVNVKLADQASGAIADELYQVTVDGDLRDILPMFMDARRKHVKQLEIQVRRNDWRGIQLSCHQARSPALTFGFAGMGEILRHLEQGALQKSEKKIKKWIFEYSFFIDQCQVSFQD